VPTQIVIELAPKEQARFLAELRHARRGHWLALHILLLLALHHSPNEIATVLLCARSTVYAVARTGKKDAAGRNLFTPVDRPV
jgi:hypothetical protein